MTAFAAALVLAAITALPQTTPVDPLTLARQRYNEQQYDEAIQLATAARGLPASANVASLVLAHAHLERFRDRRREAPDPADLAAARDAIKQVDASRLRGQNAVEYNMGMGELMYLEGETLFLPDRYGTAAEFFQLAMIQTQPRGGEALEPIFEWWANSLDRQAQFGPENDRKPLYARILQGAEAHVAGHVTSAVAAYWTAAAARGAGDLDRAFAAAAAGWLRAPHLGRAGAKLRLDLDKLMTQVILRERANRDENDPVAAYNALRTQWDLLKNQWGGW